jgi:hypothetical protein
MFTNSVFTFLIFWNSLFVIPFSSGSEDIEKSMIVVRESTIDLQIRVEDKIFVFAKAYGGLEKVKVGMHVLPFAQVPELEGIESDFDSYSWKRNKDGSIQVRSFYLPESIVLTWTIFGDGRLKLEAEGSNTLASKSLGLKFDIEEDRLKNASWQNKVKEFGEIDLEPNQANSPNLEVKSFESLKLDFTAVSVRVSTMVAESVLKFTPSYQDEETFKNSDLSFQFLLQSGQQSLQPNASGKNTIENQSNPNPVSLWFDFH